MDETDRTDLEPGESPSRPSSPYSPSRHILVIYTGGTIGMMPCDPAVPSSPLAPVPWATLVDAVTGLEELLQDAEVRYLAPIDSSDMTPAYWTRLSALIGESHDACDGFVILHGTDTMAYTASALSFLLEGLDRPVVLIGASQPLTFPDSDGMQHLRDALRVARAQDMPRIPEVVIAYQGRVLRGNRARKFAKPGQTFVSPHLPPLAEFTEAPIFRPSLVFRQDVPFRAHVTLDDNVALIRMHPGLAPAMLAHALNAPGLKGIVLETYGAGNASTAPAFLEALASGIRERNLVVLNVTQCPYGTVSMDRYSAGAGLASAGVLDGKDTTSEAALAKLQFLFGCGHSPEEVRQALTQNLRGELHP